MTYQQLGAKLPPMPEEGENRLCKHSEQKQKTKVGQRTNCSGSCSQLSPVGCSYSLKRHLFGLSCCVNVHQHQLQYFLCWWTHAICLIKCFPLWDIVSSKNQSSEIGKGEAMIPICTDKEICHKRSHYEICWLLQKQQKGESCLTMSLVFVFETGCFVYINVCFWDGSQVARLESSCDYVYGNENNIQSNSWMFHIARLLVLIVSSIFLKYENFWEF